MDNDEYKKCCYILHGTAVNERASTNIEQRVL